MSNQTLRQLAKNYAKGIVDKDVYRKSRSVLINNIISGKVSVQAINFEKPLRPDNESDEAITEGIVRERTEIIPEKQASSTKPKKTPPPVVEENVVNKKSSAAYLIISVIIVLSLIIAVILFYPKPPEPAVAVATDNSNTANNTQVAEEESIDKTVAAEALIGTFLNEKNWSDENMDKFLESWLALTDEERNYATDTKRMQRLKATIYKQFLEGKALASIDIEKSKMEQEKLIKFANDVGINDSRLVMD